MSKITELEQQVAQLTRLLEDAGIVPIERVAQEPTERGDYVEHGSEAHAALLGLRPATDDDEYKRKDSKDREWALVDTTSHGPQVTPQYLKELLRQQVAELDTKIIVQATDRNQPGYAPPMLAVYMRQLDQPSL